MQGLHILLLEQFSIKHPSMVLYIKLAEPMPMEYYSSDGRPAAG